jgi:stage III sporulation protein SpoIIIAA
MINRYINSIINILPKYIQEELNKQPNKDSLIEVVMDLGRRPEARFPDRPIYLSYKVIDWLDLDQCIKHLGNFSGENRAGIEFTLHRISSIRNREGNIIGLTCRVGRAVFGTINIIRDLLETQKSILLLGRPGVGKTTAIREIARVLADELEKRVVIIDTSNEIAGDGDIPHRSIGRARRMQVTEPERQHQVMIEAVENHMPEVIIIDEISTELETFAARTIAERGVQLVGTAHGNFLKSLIKNPTLSDLVGGIQYVTLGDEEAKRRGTQKSILERKAAPAFEIAIEIHERYCWIIHENIEKSVDYILQGHKPTIQIRNFHPLGITTINSCNTTYNSQNNVINIEMSHKWRNNLFNTIIQHNKYYTVENNHNNDTIIYDNNKKIICNIYLFAINYQNIEKIIKVSNLPISLTRNLEQADTIFALRSHIKNNQKLMSVIETKKIPLYTTTSTASNYIIRSLKFILSSIGYNHIKLNVNSLNNSDNQLEALEEARLAIEKIVIPYKDVVELIPRTPLMRKAQYNLIRTYMLKVKQFGEEPYRRLRIYP